MHNGRKVKEFPGQQKKNNFREFSVLNTYNKVDIECPTYLTGNTRSGREREKKRRKEGMRAQKFKSSLGKKPAIASIIASKKSSSKKTW